ncbi:hypothetical protein [Bacillus dakarensis]|uniref:hypothetical protein n=1 Tax=Robertmurraya dakarensis TaxID=1926278 RepID=UPI0009816DCB|nr:hypothetical protein [Bacillus dakarensis]
MIRIDYWQSIAAKWTIKPMSKEKIEKIESSAKEAVLQMQDELIKHRTKKKIRSAVDELFSDDLDDDLF